MRNRFLRIISALIVFIMAVPLSACKKKPETDDREIQSGVTVFSYYGTDPALSHEVGEAAENRVWRVGIEDYTANTVTLANEGVVAAAENVTLLRGTYVLTAELAVYGEAGKSGATNTYNPVAALQVVNDSGNSTSRGAFRSLPTILLLFRSRSISCRQAGMTSGSVPRD